VLLVPFGSLPRQVACLRGSGFDILPAWVHGSSSWVVCWSVRAQVRRLRELLAQAFRFRRRRGGVDTQPTREAEAKAKAQGGPKKPTTEDDLFVEPGG